MTGMLSRHQQATGRRLEKAWSPGECSGEPEGRGTQAARRAPPEGALSRALPLPRPWVGDI